MENVKQKANDILVKSETERTAKLESSNDEDIFCISKSLGAAFRINYSMLDINLIYLPCH
jgi:hypothetical protein